tara:strand:+ start:919 stop:1500 length:582 start_codon:yes stop_codon:yes gene_type:complete
MTDITSYDKASTSLTHEEFDDLKLSYITTKDDLNEAEQSNILGAKRWAFRRKRNVLDEKFLKSLHKKMFCEVWKWAGIYRKSGKTIGVDAYKISTDLNALLSDISFWVERKTYPMVEIAARFHHKLVYIHPFPNGNGRFSRLATDLFLKQYNEAPFSWGANLSPPEKRRKEYISALQAADDHDIDPLINFVTR